MADAAVLDAYKVARWRARQCGTARLRWMERRGRGHIDRLSQTDFAALSAIREELRDRGYEVADLPSRGWGR